MTSPDHLARSAPTSSGSERRGNPRLLFLCQNLPFPPDAGAEIRSYNVLRVLGRAFDVTALCFYRETNRPTSESVQTALSGLAPHAVVEALPVPQDASRTRLVLDHLRSMLTGRVYTRYAYRHRPMAANVRRLMQNPGFDLAHLDSLDLSTYLPLLRRVPVACTHHNVESDLLRRRAASAGSPLTSTYLRYQANLMEREERAWAPRVELNVAVSDRDADRLRRIAPGARVEVVPNGVDTSFFQPAGGPRSGIVFVGSSSWFPNRDAMDFFGESILPRIRAREHDPRVVWVGRSPADVRRRYGDRYGIRLTGYLADIRDEVHRAACYIVPLRVGGGTRLKILDAWAMGKAVVSTSVGCEGLDARDGENILIRDAPDAFAQAVVSVLEDDRLRDELGANARRTAERVYDWDVIGERLLALYMQLVGSSPSGAR